MAYASVISSSAVIRGNVRGDGSLQILGRIEGDVGVTGDVALGPDAVVVGAISGARIVIGGSVEGDVTASEAVVISETGKVVGDLSAPRIGMSEGALVRGSVRTEGVASGNSSAARARAPASRSVEADEERSRPSVVRPAPRLAPNAAPAAASGASLANTGAKPALKRPPPPPVIQAPRPGARARKRMLKR